MLDGYEPTRRQGLENACDRGMSQVARRVLAFASRELVGDGFGRGKQVVLRILSEQDGLSLSGIAEAGALDRGNVTRIVASLEEGGYLRRESDPAARHGFLVFLTPEGERAAVRVHEVLDAWNDALYEELGDDELEALAGAIGRLARRSDGLWARYEREGRGPAC